MPSLDLTDPIALLLASHDAFSAAGIVTATYGGLALAVYGVPRETQDADLALTAVDAARCIDALRAAGLDVQLAFDGIRFGGNTVSRITAIGGGELNTIDLVAPRSPRFATAMMARTLRGTLRDRELLVVSPEDFVLLKVLSTRDRDLEDAASVVTALAGLLDRDLIERELALLAAELVDHDVRGRGAHLPLA